MVREISSTFGAPQQEQKKEDMQRVCYVFKCVRFFYTLLNPLTVRVSAENTVIRYILNDFKWIRS